MGDDDLTQRHSQEPHADGSRGGRAREAVAEDQAARDLDVDFYRTVYQDLSSLPRWLAKRHWRRVGHRENRFQNMDAALAAAYQLGSVDFDPGIYLFLNEDLAPAGIDSEERAVVHYVSAGHREGRPYRLAPGGGGLLGGGPPASAEPAIERRKAWPGAPALRERSIDWNDPVDLATHILGRPLEAERAAIEEWLGPLDPFERALSVLTCEEKLSWERSLDAVPPEDFVLFACLAMFDRAPSPAEFDSIVTALDHGDLSRERLLLEWAGAGVRNWRTGWGQSRVPRPETNRREADSAGAVSTDPGSEGPESIMSSDLSFLLLGTGTMVSRADWDARVREVKSSPAAPPRARMLNTDPAEIHSGGVPLVTVLSSVFRPGDFLRPFFDQMVRQTIFDRVELVCVLVQPTEADLDIAREYQAAHPNIVLQVEDERIGIYTAWNQAVQASSGRFVTNANVDDLRRPDSLEIQARTLLRHEWVDVVYQDVLYTLDSTLTWQEIEQIGFCTKLPPVTPWTLLGQNSPHNAPMWRRALHDDLGLFDDTFQSAGDYEFWLRCVSADKVFFKVRDAHVAYYVNPNGLSTRPGGAGVWEALEIGRRYLHLLDYPEPPARLPAPDPTGPIYPRADRMTLDVCDQLVLLRSIQGA